MLCINSTYKLVSGNVPHHGMNTQRFAFLVALEDFRQSLAGFTQPMQELIQACWQRAPDRRPSFDHLCTALDKLSESNFMYVSGEGRGEREMVCFCSLDLHFLFFLQS